MIIKKATVRIRVRCDVALCEREDGPTIQEVEDFSEEAGIVALKGKGWIIGGEVDACPSCAKSVGFHREKPWGHW